MTFKLYLRNVFVVTLLLAGLFIFLNYWQDDFGLFEKKRTERRIWFHEKTTKYLMSYNYIGNNFDGILIGSSVSANMNPQLLPKYNIYNLSLNGGNISELKYLIDKLFTKDTIRYIVICLHPYMTKNSGLKSDQIAPVEYWKSLFSDLPVRVLLEKMWFMVGAQSVFHDSTSGFNDDNIFKGNFDFQAKVERKKKIEIGIHIDPVAYKELGQVIDNAHGKGIKVLAYHYPVYTGIFNRYIPGVWEKYKIEIEKLFNSEDLIWDMNSAEYQIINSEIKNYSDGHLSDQGAALVLIDIERQLSNAMQ